MTTVAPNPHSPYATANPEHRHIFAVPAFLPAPEPGGLLPTACEAMAVVSEKVIETRPGAELPDGMCSLCVAVMNGSEPPARPSSECGDCGSATWHGELCALCRQEKHAAWWPTRNEKRVVWVDGDPLMKAIAAAVHAHCETGDGGIVHDDPRNIAAVAASVARSIVLVEAADFVGNDDDCGCGGCDTCVPRKLADGLRGMAAEPPLSPYYSHDACGFHWHGRDGMDIPMRDGQPVCPRCELRRLAAEAQPTVEPETRRCPACGHVICSGDGPCGAILSVGVLSENRCACTGPATGARQPNTAPCPPGCIACATDESHDPAPTAGVGQDGAQQ